jgi:hypothetical protein
LGEQPAEGRRLSGLEVQDNEIGEKVRSPTSE